MKKTNAAQLLAWALVVAMPLWFGSCKKDSAEAVTPNSIEGTWRISGMKIDPAVDFLGTGQKSNDLLAAFRALPNGLGNDFVACLTDTRITFNNGGKVTGQTSAKCNASTDEFLPAENNSTWKLDGNKLTITSGSDVTVYDTTLSGNTLSMSQKDTDDLDGDGKTETYTITIEMTKV